MGTLNKIMIIGRLGNKPELQQTRRGQPYCRLSVATESAEAKEDGSWAKRTQWHSIHVFGKNALNCTEYLSKGRQVFVEGRLDHSKTEDDGKSVWRTFILGEKVDFMGFAKAKEAPETTNDGDDDIASN